MAFLRGVVLDLDTQRLKKLEILLTDLELRVAGQRSYKGCLVAGFLPRLAVVEGDDAAAVDAPGDVVLVLAGGDAGIALDATVAITEELHSCHDGFFRPSPLKPARCGTRSLWLPA